MKSICGSECCSECPRQKECGGCTKVNGHPFGGQCVAAMCVQRGGFETFLREKDTLIAEINALGIQNLVIEDIGLLNGFVVTLAYPLPNGASAKFFADNNVYWGTQVALNPAETPVRYYGVVADGSMILVSSYTGYGENPALVLYKKR